MLQIDRQAVADQLASLDRAQLGEFADYLRQAEKQLHLAMQSRQGKRGQLDLTGVLLDVAEIRQLAEGKRDVPGYTHA